MTKSYDLSIKGRYRLLRYRAKREGVACDLTLEQYAALIGPNACHYCGHPLASTGAGLDRKIPGEDYTAINVVPACSECNLFKTHLFSYEEMLILGRTVAQIKTARVANHS